MNDAMMERCFKEMALTSDERFEEFLMFLFVMESLRGGEKWASDCVEIAKRERNNRRAISN